MKKKKKKLRLNLETLQELDGSQLPEAAGASHEYCTVICTSICPWSENCPAGPSAQGCTGPIYTAAVGC